VVLLFSVVGFRLWVLGWVSNFLMGLSRLGMLWSCCFRFSVVSFRLGLNFLMGLSRLGMLWSYCFRFSVMGCGLGFDFLMGLSKLEMLWSYSFRL